MAERKITTKLLDKRRKAARTHATRSPEIVDGEMINDGPEKLDTGREVLVLPTGEEDPTKYTVSPFRAMLADRGKTIAANYHVPTANTRKGVMYAAGLGLSQEAIAKVIGISLPTLRSHYDEELSCAQNVMMADIQANLYNIARDPKHKDSVKSGIFLLSKLGGETYKEKSALELSGPDGKPLQIDQQSRTIDPTLLSPEQRDALRDIVGSALKLAQAAAPAMIEGEYTDVN